MLDHIKTHGFGEIGSDESIKAHLFEKLSEWNNDLYMLPTYEKDAFLMNLEEDEEEWSQVFFYIRIHI